MRHDQYQGKGKERNISYTYIVLDWGIALRKRVIEHRGGFPFHYFRHKHSCTVLSPDVTADKMSEPTTQSKGSAAGKVRKLSVSPPQINGNRTSCSATLATRSGEDDQYGEEERGAVTHRRNRQAHHSIQPNSKIRKTDRAEKKKGCVNELTTGLNRHGEMNTRGSGRWKDNSRRLSRFSGFSMAMVICY